MFSSTLALFFALLYYFFLFVRFIYDFHFYRATVKTALDGLRRRTSNQNTRGTKIKAKRIQQYRNKTVQNAIEIKINKGRDDDFKLKYSRTAYSLKASKVYKTSIEKQGHLVLIP